MYPMYLPCIKNFGLPPSVLCPVNRNVKDQECLLLVSVFEGLNLLFLKFRMTFALIINGLVGLVVKASASRAEDPGFESRLRRDFSGSSHTSDLKIGTPVASLPGAWRYRISTGTGRPGVSILRLGEVESLTCDFNHSVAARKIV